MSPLFFTIHVEKIWKVLLGLMNDCQIYEYFSAIKNKHSFLYSVLIVNHHTTEVASVWQVKLPELVTPLWPLGQVLFVHLYKINCIFCWLSQIYELQCLYYEDRQNYPYNDTSSPPSSSPSPPFPVSGCFCCEERMTDDHLGWLRRMYISASRQSSRGAVFYSGS